MKNQRKNHSSRKVIIFSFILSIFFSVNTFAAETQSSDPNKYLNAVREFADNVLEYGRDTYGLKQTPLFVDGVNVNTHEPVKWIDPNGTKWILSNLASQQTLFRTLDGLTTITGDSKYHQAAIEALKYTFEYLQTTNGLLPWGGHQAYNATTDTMGGEPTHELKGIYPYYELMWKAEPNATEYFIGSFWSGHISDWSTLAMDRHCYDMVNPFEEPWNHEYVGGSVFLQGTTSSFFNTGSDLIYAAVELAQLSGSKEPVVWVKRLAKRYVDVRDPNTGISYGMYTLKNKQKVPDSYDDVLRKLVPGATDFPVYPFPGIEINPKAREAVSGYMMTTPGVKTHRYLLNWLSLLMVGEMLGSEGDEIRQWALEELTAFGHGYRKDDNVYIPMLSDGTNLEGYVVKVDGPLGPKGVTLEPIPAGPSDLWIYSMAYRVMNDDFMWELTRNISIGNKLGDIGESSKESPQLNLSTNCNDPFAILSFLELHRATGKSEFLEMAKIIGNNVLDTRFHNGFFVASKKHIYSKFGTLDSIALLHLYSALAGVSAVIPEVWPTTPSFEGDYRMKEDSIDNKIFYALTEYSEPPLSLQEAAAMGDIDLVKSMLEKGVDVDAIESSFYTTALHRAAKAGHKDVVELLLSEGANIEAVGSYPYATPLYHAVQQGHMDVVELLIAHDADINVTAISTPESAGDTPLHAALKAGQTDLVKLLLKAGANVNIQDRNGSTPLLLAVQNNKIDLVKLLLDAGADINIKNNRSQTPLDLAQQMAQQRGQAAILELIKSDAKISSIYLAAQLGNSEKVRAFLEQGIDVNAKDENGQTALYIAVNNDNKEIVQLLIEKGANVNAKNDDGQTPLDIILNRPSYIISSNPNHTLIRDMLVSNGAEILSIHAAVKFGDLETVKELLEQGIDTNSKDVDGDTPLIIAVSRDNNDIAKLLIENGANVNTGDGDNNTPLYYAALAGNLQIVEFLVSKGTDVNIKNQIGMTPLYVAVLGNNVDVVKLLLDKGADANVSITRGFRRGAGASLTLIDMAQQRGYTEIVELLREHGAEPSEAGTTPQRSARRGMRRGGTGATNN